MTAQEHFDLYEHLNKQAMEQLRKAGECEFVCDAIAEYNEYLRISKLANKHYGIWMGVMTRQHRAWCRKHGVAPSY